MVPVGGIINISGKIAEYFGLVEGVSTQVTKLVHQAFKSAKDNLQYARTASGQNQMDYVKRAKDLFIDAVSVEENENKILALVGLSMCQYLIGDYSGAQQTLGRIDDVQLTCAEIIKANVKGAVLQNSTLYPMRLVKFNVIKEKARTTNLSLIDCG